MTTEDSPEAARGLVRLVQAVGAWIVRFALHH